MSINVLTLDMRSELIYTLMIIPDADIIYGISTNLYNKSIENITQEFINSITCNDDLCYELGHYHKDNKNKHENNIISQSIIDNILELIFNYNGKIRKFIYQHGSMSNDWNKDIKEFQHIIIPFIANTIDTSDRHEYIKLMIKSRAYIQPYFYIQSEILPIFIPFSEKFKLVPSKYKDYAEGYENNIEISRTQINMDDKIWFTNAITGNRFIRCKNCNEEYKVKRFGVVEDFQKKKELFKCKNKKYCDFTEIYNKD